MSLNDLASIGSLVSGVAVLISLVFLYFQLRQVKRNQQALISQDRTNRVMELALRASDPALSRIYGKGLLSPEAFTGGELGSYLAFCRALLISAEESALQHGAGLLDRRAYDSFVTGMREMFARNPGLRAAWKLTSYQYGPDFTAFMEGVVLSAPPIKPGDEREAWVRILREDASAGPRPHASRVDAEA